MSVMVVGLILLGLGIVAVIKSMPVWYDYDLDERGIRVFVLRRITVWRIPFDTIKSIRLFSWDETWLWAMAFRIGNRIRGNSVLVERRAGLIRRIALTPRDPIAFVREVSRHLESGEAHTA